jgi:mannose-6-phosphate isomerase-like protein (cupin superfamily)
LPTAEPPAAVATVHVDDAPEVLAPDGSAVRVLVRTAGGSMARFSLPGFGVSRAVVHRTVDELWYFIAGCGQMWLRYGEQESIADVVPGTSIAIPVGTEFQFRSCSADTLHAVGVTIPPWPGESEAAVVTGPWSATV